MCGVNKIIFDRIRKERSQSRILHAVLTVYVCNIKYAMHALFNARIDACNKNVCPVDLLTVLDGNDSLFLY